MSDVLNLLDHGVPSQAHFLYKKQPGYEALVMMGYLSGTSSGLGCGRVGTGLCREGGSWACKASI